MSSRGSSKSEDRNTIRIREIQVGVSENKRCFDCRQRGPNYVNVSVGAFVCTKCSGMLRGVTPPHRIKSISMSTFTNEDVSLLDSRGNLWCQKVWLATFSGSLEEEFTSLGDEVLKQHILDKYEKKRYYLDPSSISNLESYSSSYLRQNAKTSLGTLASPSSSLIGSRISQKLASSHSPSGGKVIRNGMNGGLQSGHVLNGVPRSSESSNIQVMVDPFSSPFSQSAVSNGSKANSNLSSGFEAFANFETANFESPPTGPCSSSSPPFFPSPPTIRRSNLNEQSIVVPRTNLHASVTFDANNNPRPTTNGHFDLHFTARPVLSVGSPSSRSSRSSINSASHKFPSLPSSSFVNTNTNSFVSPVRSSLPLLTHDSNAVERRKKAKLHLDMRERPWVNFASELSPPPLPNRKKYIPISKSKSSSVLPSMSPSAGGETPFNQQQFIIRSHNNPFLPGADLNNNPFVEDVENNQNMNNLNNSNPNYIKQIACSSVDDNEEETLRFGIQFFNSLINNSPTLRVVDDCSVTNITDPLSSFRVGTTSSTSTTSNPPNSFSSTTNTTAIINYNKSASPEPNGVNNSTLRQTGAPLIPANHRTSTVVSPTLLNTSSSEDRYAALKDLDEIFRSAHISSDPPSDVNGHGKSNFINNSSSSSAVMNGVSSIFGTGADVNPSGGGISSLFEASSPNNSSNDCWKRLSSNSSSDNAGWANFGSSATTTPSSSSASNPFNLGGGGGTSQLNTSPWPTTGTSPVQSGGNAFANGGGLFSTTDPFSVTNQSFQNSSEILSNDLFANAPKPNGGTKNSNLNNHVSTGENFFGASPFLDNAVATSNPWDSTPMAFTDNMTPSFNPKNPFL